jgi:hypothetical protein
VATAVTAYAMDGLKFVDTPARAGLVQAAFSGPGRATWAVYDDGGVIGRQRLDLTRLPAGVEVLDVMGNDPRQAGQKSWEIGIQPLFVLSGKLPTGKLAAACLQAVLAR